jgi:hypothetical protein
MPGAPNPESASEAGIVAFSRRQARSDRLSNRASVFPSLHENVTFVVIEPAPITGSMPAASFGRRGEVAASQGCGLTGTIPAVVGGRCGGAEAFHLPPIIQGCPS